MEASTSATNRAVLQLMSDAATRQLLASRAGSQFGGERDMFATLGYPEAPTLDDYYAHYLRGGIAGTIVDAPPNTTWRRAPVIHEADESESTFAEAANQLIDRLRATHYWERVDRLAGVGNYAVLLIGSRTGQDLAVPLSADTISGPEDIVFLSVFRQKHADVKGYVDDPADPRFGRPEMYEITLDANRERQSVGARDGRKPTGSLGKSTPVHQSRVIHVAEHLLEDEVFGRPRLERAYNHLLDLLKIGGGSAEMFWNNVAGIWHGDIDADVDVDAETLGDLEDDIIAAMHKARRVVLSRSLDLQQVGGGTPDPTGVFEVIKALISATVRIPQRILFGAERGELASSQDQAEWFARISERQVKYAEPTIVRPFIDRMIETGALPEPSDPEGYMVEWESLFELTEKEEAEAAAARGQAFASASANGMRDIAGTAEIREKVLGWKPERPDQEDVDAAVKAEDADMAAALDIDTQ